MLTALSLVLSIMGFAALALAMDRHHGKLAPSNVVLLRMAGTALLAASLGFAIAAQGIVVGVILWLGLLSPAALTVAVVLAAAGASGSRRHRAAARPRA